MEFNGLADNQGVLGLDDGTGLRVVHATAIEERPFSWELFEGYDTLRVLTYSASTPAIVRMLDKFSFASFECVFGSETTLRDIKSILAFQKIVVGDTRAAIMGLKDERHLHILARVHAGQARFRVLRKSIAHAKLYLLSSVDGRTRVVVGSANLSEQAFSGRQPETLVCFDNDERAWGHYNRMYELIRDSASDEIPLPEEQIVQAEIEVDETPVMLDKTETLVIEPSKEDELLTSVPVQVSRIEKVAAILGPRLSPALPVMRNGRQHITPEVKREISRIRLVKSVEEADNRYFSIDRTNRTALLSGSSFPLEFDNALVQADAQLLLGYFKNYEDAFEGNVPTLQRDYFTLMSWIYFSPFFCELRSLALVQDTDVIRYPSFAIVFGKSNCGKTSLVETLTTSMFHFAPTVDKASFTRAQLRSLQQAYKRMPVVFDDIGRTVFRNHGVDVIKNEYLQGVDEHPGFILSMNAAEPQSFPDEVVKRCLMIYTTTALPSYNESLRQTLQGRVQQVRHALSGHLYRRYLVEVMDALDAERLPEDWLALSSGIISGLLAGFDAGSLPSWAKPITWLEYASKRYDRVQARLSGLLRDSTRSASEGDTPSGWTVDGSRVIYWEPRDVFGRGGFNWEDVPSTLIDQDASSGGRTVLYRARLEEFLGRRLGANGPWWWPFR